MKNLLWLGVAGLLGMAVVRNFARRHERTPWKIVSKRGDSPNSPKKVDKFRLTSPAFAPGKSIPAAHACEADDQSPPLIIEGVPDGARSMALIMEDLDVPMPTIFDHWLVWNIPPNTRELPAGRIPKEAVQGKNSLKKIGYNGPCPPNGTHHYHFRLFALDTWLDLPEGSSKKELKAAMKGHILAESDLIGRYSANSITRGNLSLAMLEAAGRS